MNILRFKYYRICKSYNLSVNKNMKLNDIILLLDEYFIKKNSIKKIIKAYKIYKIQKNKKNIEKIILENEELKKQNFILNNQNIIDLKKENFILKSKINDIEYKNKNYNSILSNYKKYIEIINENKNIEIDYLINNKKTYNTTPKLSINEMKKILIENNIIIGNKSKHFLKKAVNEISNKKYFRICDRIIDINKKIKNV